MTINLASLYLVLERELNGEAATRIFPKVLAQAQDFIWLGPPVPNGSITIVEISQACDLLEHEKLVNAWARDVWAAWFEHHKTIEQLIEKHLG